MKIAHKWRGGGILSAKIVAAMVAVVALVGLMVPMARADGRTFNVPGGSGTLKSAVAEAQDGDVYRLSAASYSGDVNDRTVDIKKSITIEGAGGMSGRTVLNVPIKITEPNVTVTLKGFASSPAIEDNFTFIQIAAENVTLNIEDIRLWGILRGTSGGFKQYNVRGIDLTDAADGSHVTLKNSVIQKPGMQYAVAVNASETEVLLDNSAVEGHPTIYYNDGDNNQLKITNNSEVDGPATQYKDTAVMVFDNQTDMKIDVENSIVSGKQPSVGTWNIQVFKFSDGSSANINITGSDVHYQDKQDTESTSTVFDFGVNAAAGDFEIAVDSASQLRRSIIDRNFEETETKNLTPRQLSNILSQAAVIGVFDREGNGKIKLYSGGVDIAELKDDQYIKQDGYNFKGWFQNFDGKEYAEEFCKPGEDCPKTQIGQNLNLYAKFAKIVKVQFGEEEPEELEENDTLSKILDIDGKLTKLVREDQNHKGFVLHGTAEGSEFLHRVDEGNIEELKKYPITEDVKIEAIHSVSLFVNGEEFEVNVGENVEAIGSHADEKYKGTQDGYEQARLNGKNEDRFSRLVYEDSGETFDPSLPINSNTKVKTKHFAMVTIGEETFRVEQGKKITEDENGQLLNKLQEIKDAPVDYKTFARFEDDEGNEVKIEGDITTVSEDTDDLTISPKYQVKVAIADKEYIFDEGKKLNELNEKQDEIKKALQSLVDEAGERNFKGFVISTTGGEIRRRIPTTKEEANSKFDEILGLAMDKNTTIYAEYNAKITINCPDNGCDGKDKDEFEMETGTTLTQYAEGHQADYNKAKYQKYVEDEHKTDRFARFVNADTGEEFGEEQEIEKSMTLTPKYFMIVTIADDRGDVAGIYKVEQDKTIEDLTPLNGQVIDIAAVLSKLQNDITPSQEELDNNPEAPSMHFEKLVKTDEGKGGDAIGNEPITEDMSIMGLYHYDVIIVENYDEPNADLGGVDDGRYGFKIYKGEKLSANDQAQSVLDKLKNSVNTSDESRRFNGKFLEINANKQFDEATLLDTVFNRHVYINAIPEYRVKIAGDDDKKIYVEDQQALNANPSVEAEMKVLKEAPGKHWTSFTLNDEEKTEEEVLNSVIDGEQVEIGAKYEVWVKIGNATFKIPEGKTLRSLGRDDEIKNALEALKNSEQTFEGFSAGNDAEAVLDAQFYTDTEVVALHSITVTIDGESGQKFEDVMTGESLNNSAHIDKGILDEYKKNRCGDKEFSRFVLNGETFTEETPFTKDTALTTKCAVKIAIDDDSYLVEEDMPLSSNELIVAKVEGYQQNPDKVYQYLIDDGGREVKLEDILSANTALKPFYKVRVNIAGTDFMVDENKTLNDYVSQEELTTHLDQLEKNLTDKSFNKYVIDGEELGREELLKKQFSSNAVVTVTYNVTVTLGETTVTLPQGSTLASSNELKQAMHDFVPAHGKANVVGFTDKEGAPVDENYIFDTNTIIEPQYTVLVKIKGTMHEEEGEEIPDGATVEAAVESMKEVRGKTEKRFKEQFAEGLALDAAISEEKTLTPLYEVDVTVEGDKTYTLDENQTLGDLYSVGWQEPEEFVEFRDMDGNKLELGEPLTKHTRVQAIRNVVVTLPDGSELKVESGKTLNDIPGIESTLEKLRLDPTGEEREFARFMDQNTGATINPTETKLQQNIKLVPKFYNLLTVFRTDEAGEPVEPEHTLKLEEGLPMSKMSGDERNELNKWINENKEALAAEGKTDYDVKQYIYNSLPVDENATLFDDGGRIEAVFAYSPKPVTPPAADTTDEDQTPTTPKAPNTGSDMTAEEQVGFGAMLAIVMSATLGLGTLVVAKRMRQ